MGRVRARWRDRHVPTGRCPEQTSRSGACSPARPARLRVSCDARLDLHGDATIAPGDLAQVWVSRIRRESYYQELFIVRARIRRGRVEVQDPIPPAWDGQTVK